MRNRTAVDTILLFQTMEYVAGSRYSKITKMILLSIVYRAAGTAYSKLSKNNHSRSCGSDCRRFIVYDCLVRIFVSTNQHRKQNASLSDSDTKVTVTYRYCS